MDKLSMKRYRPVFTSRNALSTVGGKPPNTPASVWPPRAHFLHCNS